MDYNSQKFNLMYLNQLTTAESFLIGFHDLYIKIFFNNSSRIADLSDYDIDPFTDNSAKSNWIIM
ncbi:17044_t:CDS:2 [Funneliformis geosporum]|uniref:17044_t:CDS:1 n=1 Tax=Funneliformis geosporum TaxID=1117311 RepID=A0A9W4SMZ0_9GLOM|nr:17044_t:CDS:2 [Funneliformis geosporum]